MLLGHWDNGRPLEARPGPTGTWQAAGKKQVHTQHCRNEVHGYSGSAARDGLAEGSAHVA